MFANICWPTKSTARRPRRRPRCWRRCKSGRCRRAARGIALPDPFFVLATQNPIEQEGTYPLPEAQLDRFLFKVFVGYPTPDEERQIYRRTTGSAVDAGRASAVRRRDSAAARAGAPGADLAITRSTMPWRWSAPRAPAATDRPTSAKWIAWGAGPRAGQALILAAKARAALDGRTSATIDDIRAVAQPVLRHRLVTTYAAQAEGQTPDTIIAALLRDIPARTGVDRIDGQVSQILRS